MNKYSNTLGITKLGELYDGTGVIDVSDDIRIDEGKYPISAIVQSTYPCLTEHPWEAKYFQERATLAPTNKIVETVNDHVLSTIPEKEKEYFSSNAISKEEKNFGINEHELNSSIQ